MTHPLREKLADVRGRIRRRWIAHGLGRFVAIGLAAVILLGAIDAVARFQDQGLRVMLSLTLLAVTAWAAYRFLYTAWRTPLLDVDLARRLQRRFPQLGETLAGAVEFLDQAEDDPVAGSADLRRAVIHQAVAKVEAIDLASAIDTRPVWYSAITAAAVCMTALVLAVLDPLGAQIAVARLAYPLGDITWPRENYLILHPRVDRVARGQAFEIEVIDRYDGPLPSRVRIHYRSQRPDGSTAEETETMRPLGRGVVARRENVTRPFAYRVSGGDDDTMDWIDVEVVDPPAVASVRASVFPPAYSGLPPSQGEGNLRVLIGSGVRFEAVATKPLESARLCLNDGRTFPCERSDDGRRIVAPPKNQEPLRITASGDYRFELTDRQGLANTDQDRRPIEAVHDRPPSVELQQPEGVVHATPRAVVPLRVVARDDLALAQVKLSARADEVEKPKEAAASPKKPRSAAVPLFTGPKEPPTQADAATAGQRETIAHRWSLESLRLKPGDQVAFDVTATDYLGQSGASTGHRLVIVTPDELLERLAQQQRFLLTELTRAVTLSRQSRAQVGRLEIQLGELKRLEGPDVDRLRGAELTQREAADVLTGPADGVAARAGRLLDDLANNQIDSPDLRRRMESLVGEINRLAGEPLPAVAQALTAAIKSAQLRLETTPDAASRDVETADLLHDLSRRQDEVIAALERLAAELAEWDDYRRFHRDTAQLLRDQRALTARTSETTQKTLGKELRELPPADVAALKVLGQEQLELARRLDQLLQRMGQVGARLVQRDPLAAETLSDAKQRADELGIGGRMRGAGEDLGENRAAQAARRQGQAAADLEEILDILAGRRGDELVRLVKRLGAAQQDLTDLTQRQEELRKRLDQASANPSDSQRRRQLRQLAAQQQELRRQAQRLARRLQRLLAADAAKSLDAAATKMAQAGESAGAGQAGKASRDADEAKKALDDAARQLAQRRRQAAEDLAAQQAARLTDDIKSLHQRQSAAIEETRRLEGLRQVQGRLRPAQEDSLRQLAEDQTSLGEQTRRLAEKLSAAGVFHLALSDAADAMARAAAWLGRGRTDASTSQPQQEALNRLAGVLESLKPEPPGEQPDKPSSGGEGDGKGGPPKPPGEGVPALAQLKLLRAMQEEVRRDTRAWQRRFGDAEPLPDDARADRDRLSVRQGRLADLMLQWVKPRPPAPEEAPVEPLQEER